MIPMRDGVKLHTVIMVPKGAHDAPMLLTRTPYNATGMVTKTEHGQLSGTWDRALRATTTPSRHRGWRLHPRDTGRSRQVRLRGRLRDEPAAARAAQPHARGRGHRHLRHHRLAGEERTREQRQGRHSGDFLRRLPAVDGPGQPAPGAQGRGADEPDGRRLDGRRLVPQRRVPRAEHALHLRAGSDPRQQRQMVEQLLRRLRSLHALRLGGRAGRGPWHGADRLLEDTDGASGL